MSNQDLKKLAAECLAKVFKGDTTVPVHVVQAAVVVLNVPESE